MKTTELEQLRKDINAMIDAIINAIPANDMQAKLEEAKLKYPIGTEFKSTETFIKKKVDKGLYIGDLYPNYIHALDDKGEPNGVIYNSDTDTWAEIIPQDKGAVLIEQAKKIGFKVGVKYQPILHIEDNGQHGTCTGIFTYHEETDSLSCGYQYIYEQGIWATIIQEPIIIDGKEVVIRGTMVGISGLVFSRRQIETFQSLNPIFKEILKRMEEKNGDNQQGEK